MKKNIVQIVVSASLIATLGGGALALTGCSQPQEEQTLEIVEVEEDAYKVNVTAEGWDAETSTPAVLSFQKIDGSVFVYADRTFDTLEELQVWASSEEGKGATGDVLEQDKPVGEPLYFSVPCNVETDIDLDEGTYALAVVTPINADGSVYATPEVTHVSVPAEGAEPLALTLIRAEDVASDQITSTIEALTLVNAVDPKAVTSEVLALAVRNAEANPYVSAEQVASAENTAKQTASSGDASAAADRAVSGSVATTSPAPAPAQTSPTSPSQSGNAGASQPAPSQSGNSGYTGTTNPTPAPAPAPTQSAQPSAPSHTHSFTIPVTEQVWIDEGSYLKCTYPGCGWTGASEESYADHIKSLGRGVANGHSYTVIEQGHYENQVVGYKCSCGVQQ